MVTTQEINDFAYSTLTKDNAYSNMAQLFVMFLIVVVMCLKKWRKNVFQSQAFIMLGDEYNSCDIFQDENFCCVEVFRKEFVRGRREKKTRFRDKQFHDSFSSIKTGKKKSRKVVTRFHSQSLNFKRLIDGPLNDIGGAGLNIERLCVFLYAFQRAKDVQMKLCLVHQFLSAYFPYGAHQFVYNYFKQLFGFEILSQSDLGFISQAGSFDDFTAVFNNYKDIRHSEFAQKVVKFVTFLITTFFCERGEHIRFSWHGFDLFHATASKNNVSLVDFLEVCVETAILFCKKGVAYFHDRDFRCLFTDVDYDSEFAFVVSRLPLLETGNIDLIDCDEHEYFTRLDALIEKTNAILKRTKDSQLKNIFAGKLLKLEQAKAQLILCQKNSNMRVKPFSLLLFGKSSVAKSKLCNLLCNFVLQVNDFAAARENITTMNSNDRFQTDYLPQHNAVIFDDLCNAKAPFIVGNPVDHLIKFINNVQTAALKADISGKGNVMIRPKVVMATTNVKHLDSYKYSNEPVSVMRRFNYVVTVSIKPRFTMNDSHMLDPTKTDLKDPIQDIWLLTVQRVVPVKSKAPGSPDTPKYKNVVFEKKVLENVGLPIVLRFLASTSKEHFTIQNSLLELDDKLFEEVICPHHVFKSMCQQCSSDQGHPEEKVDMDAQSQDVRFDMSSQANFITTGWLYMEFAYFIHKFCNANWFNRYLSEKFFKYQTISTYLSLFKGFSVWTFVGTCTYFAPITVMWSLVLYMCSTYLSFLYVFSWINNRYLKSFVNSVDTVSKFREWHQGKMSKMKICGLTICTILSILTVWKMCVKMRYHAQGSEASIPVPQEGERVNVWKKCYKQPVPSSHSSLTTTREQLVKAISRRTAHVRLVYHDGVSQCNIFPICSNVWLIPTHVVQRDCVVHVTRQDKTVVGTNFVSRVQACNKYSIPGTDYTVLYLPEGGENKDFRSYLLNVVPYGLRAGTLIYKDSDANVREYPVSCRSISQICTDKARFMGLTYQLDTPTFKGMCMSPLVSDSRSTYIAGFHLAGKDSEGTCGLLTRDQIDDAIQKLAEYPEVQLTTSDGTFPRSKYGVDFATQLSDPHAKSPLNFLPDDGVVRVYGSHSVGRRSFKTNVVRSIISDDVSEIMGLECKHGGAPKMNSYIHWQRHLEAMSKPTNNFDREILRSAYNDFHDDVFSYLNANCKYKETIHPLPDSVALFGADGVYGIDTINYATSVGWPLNVPKKRFLGEDRPIEGVTGNKDIDPRFLEEVSRMEQCFLRGERCYAVQRANLKDTPTKLTTDKVRVFAGSEFAFLILVRKYYLTICKFIMEHSELFECAVGINAHGPDWTKLTKFIGRYGAERCVAGDYKRYDASMSANITLPAMRLFRDIAQWAGYTNNQLRVMDGIATEICYPLYEYNGDFLSVFGSNPSGQPLTVFLNNVANSLYLRYAYYSIYGRDCQVKFKDVVSVMCYGDDNKMTVKEGFSEFNHTSIANALSLVGITYTMADKESESVPYIHVDDATFLKRSAIWNEEVQQYFAPIEEATLSKMLHAHLKSQHLSEREHAAETIENVLREWFFYGRETYDLRRAQLFQVAERNGLSNMLNEMPDYDKAMANYKEKYCC